MGLLSNISIYRKLVLMQVITAVIVVLICSTTLVVMSYNSDLKTKTSNLISIANVMSSNVVAPIVFHDNEAVNEVLNDLKVETDITNACVLDTSLTIFGYYSKQGAIHYPFNNAPKDKVVSKIQDNYMYVYYKVISDGDWIGTVCLRADLKSLQEQLYTRIRVMGWIVLIGALIAYLISTYLQKYISKPINKLMRVTENIIQTQNYSLRSSFHGKDEIGKMSHAYNKMLDQIELHAKELSNTNNELEDRVKLRTEKLEEQNLKLMAATELAEQSKQAKDAFLASMSHEIRTPLNAIIGFQTLLRDTPLNEEQRDYVESIDFAGKNLLIIINDILDISKIEAGKFTFNKEDLNIEATIHSAIHLMDYKAKEKQIEIVLNHDKNIPKNLIGDLARFNQIILNLLGNAVKFTDVGSITINDKLVEETKTDVLCAFEIIDTGIGIAKNKQEIIFEHFSQASSETSRRFGGTGLGLTIVKKLLLLQGGDISLKSEENKGSTFSFYLRFQKEDGAIQKLKPLELTTYSSIVFDKTRTLRVLLVEDTILNQRLVKKIIEKWGYQLDVANNGVEAIDLHTKNTYDIILMDIQMPIMDGYATTQHIRAMMDVDKKSVPIIALTAHASQDEAERCIKMGMNTYISKPFNPDFLRNSILQLTSEKLINPKNNLHNIVNTTDNLYDLSYLKDHADGDYVFLVDMINTFLTDTPEFMVQLKQDINAGDYDKIKVTSHSMKGLFLTLGMNDAAKHLKEIETWSVQGSPLSMIETNYFLIESLFNNVKQHLEKDLIEFKSQTPV